MTLLHLRDLPRIGTAGLLLVACSRTPAPQVSVASNSPEALAVASCAQRVALSEGFVLPDRPTTYKVAQRYHDSDARDGRTQEVVWIEARTSSDSAWAQPTIRTGSSMRWREAASAEGGRIQTRIQAECRLARGTTSTINQ